MTVDVRSAASAVTPGSTGSSTVSPGSVHLRRREGLRALNPSALTAQVGPGDPADPGPSQEWPSQWIETALPLPPPSLSLFLLLSLFLSCSMGLGGNNHEHRSRIENGP